MRSFKMAATALVLAATAAITTVPAHAAPVDVDSAQTSAVTVAASSRYDYVHDYYHPTTHGLNVCINDAAALRRNGWQVTTFCDFANDGSPEGAWLLAARRKKIGQ